MARKKMNQIPELSRTINIRLNSTLDREIREICKKHDLPISNFGRKACAEYLGQIKDKSSLFEGVTQ